MLLRTAASAGPSGSTHAPIPCAARSRADSAAPNPHGSSRGVASSTSDGDAIGANTTAVAGRAPMPLVRRLVVQRDDHVGLDDL